MSAPEQRVRVLENFKLRDYQKDFWRALTQENYKYAAIVWARRHGKDICSWNYAIYRACLQPLDVTYVFPTADMGKKNLWKAKTNDGFKFTDFIPLELRKRRNKTDDGLNDTDRSVELINGSIIRLETGENADRLRGANSKLYVLSEYAEMNPNVLDVIEPVVEANGGQIVVNFTPKGDNHAKGAWESWKANPAWFTQMITALDTDVFTEEQLQRIRGSIIDRFMQQGRSEIEAISYFEQEYMCNFDTPMVGSYYGEQLARLEEDNRLATVPYETDLLVDTWWDLGMDDSTTIWFVQHYNREVRLIDYYENSGEGLSHYAKVLSEKPYTYGQHIAPHDIRVREMGTGVSRIDTARQLGISFIIAPRLGLEDGINQSRILLSRCWFDEDKTRRGYSALKAYHKDYDEVNKVYKTKPKHDWSSHGADAFRTGAVSIKRNDPEELPPMDDIDPSYMAGVY